MSQISLTASMRSNLLSLQGTAELMSQTQERLATGKKVNSAIDNPSSYYTAQSLNNRANDLSSLLDSMGQAVSTIKAANEGIESITSFVEQAKAVSQSAADTTDISARKKYAEQYDSLMDQINSMANDSGYKGINLLKGEDLTVKFSENGSDLDIKGVDATYDTGLKLSKIGADADSWTGKAGTDTADKTVAALSTELGVLEAGTIIKVSGESAGNQFYITTAASTEHQSVSDLVTAGNAHKLTQVDDLYYDIGATADTTGDTISAAVKKGQIVKVGPSAGTSFDYYVVTADATASDKVADLVSNGKAHKLTNVDDVYYDVEGGAAAINDVVDKVIAAINTLRTYASTFGNNYSIVQTREEFTNNLINVLEEGADKLTLADMNEESANMLALQTRQQLAINSLSLASQAAQSVLQLFS